MQIPDLIKKKRDKEQLTEEEIKFFVEQLVEKRVEPCQLGAMLMAIFLNGMDEEERTVLTSAMTYSGKVLSWPEEWKNLLVDKHSTGGVGDKVSLVLAPALAACGLKVPMISGRGLGFTGGTLDKLESIPGFTVELTLEQMQNCLSVAGCCIAGQTQDLVPADRLMYAARDVTATVDNISLITASIISKKAAEGISGLVLDVKIGRGAFVRNLEDGRLLAKSLVTAANGMGIKTSAVLTAMDSPIGKTVGNSLEVEEAILTLRGQGPEDFLQLVLVNGGVLLHSTGLAATVADGEKLLAKTITNGTALKIFEKMIVCQNVDPSVAHELCHGDFRKILPQAKFQKLFKVSSSGYIYDIDSLAVARVTGSLGASRQRAADVILPGVGVRLLVGIGDHVIAGQAWAELHHETDVPELLLQQLEQAVTISEDPVTSSASRLLDIVS